MTLEEIAKWCRYQARRKPARVLRELARAAESYRPQTHVETYALGEIFDAAAGRMDGAEKNGG
jgi:hypothetical protein